MLRLIFCRFSVIGLFPLSPFKRPHLATGLPELKRLLDAPCAGWKPFAPLFRFYDRTRPVEWRLISLILTAFMRQIGQHVGQYDLEHLSTWVHWELAVAHGSRLYFFN